MRDAKKDIKPSRYSEKKIVEIFGTQKQKEAYEEKKKLSPNMRYCILSQASSVCTLSYIGKGHYTISAINPSPLPKRWDMMNTGFYRYLMPALLNYILRSDGEEIDLCPTRWAIQIGILNTNYLIIEEHKASFMRRYFPNYGGLLTEVYSRINHALKYYADYLIDYLAAANIIQTQSKLFTFTCEYMPNVKADNVGIGLQWGWHATTEEEFSIRDECEAIANKEEQKGSRRWNLAFYRLLHSHNIQGFRNGYKLLNADKEKCKFLLKECSCSINDETIQEMAKYFISYLTSNAQKRLAKEPAEYCAGYCKAYQRVCEILISPAAKIYYEYLVKGL